MQPDQRPQSTPPTPVVITGIRLGGAGWISLAVIVFVLFTMPAGCVGCACAVAFRASYPSSFR